MSVEDVFNKNKLNEQKHRLAFAKDMAIKFHDWVENINTVWYDENDKTHTLFTTEKLYDNFLIYITEKTNREVNELMKQRYTSNTAIKI